MNVRANKHLLLWTSLATLAVLATAAFEENVDREWRRLQRAYRARRSPAEAAEVGVQLRQVFNPEIGASDRCITCHLGMAPGVEGIDGDPLFAPHPDVVHDPAEFGCVICHGGQGRATRRDDAHGDVHHWPEPMVPLEYAGAGCGACHTHLAVPNLTRLRRGEALFERYDCLACHAVDGRGGTLRPGGTDEATGPDLSRVGTSGYTSHWYEAHERRHRAAARGPWRFSFGPIAPEERRTIEAFLDSRFGAPELIEAKAIFHSLGCRGCHKLGGVGGDDGPELTHVGEKDPGQLDFTHVRGPGVGGGALAAWLSAHTRAPATVVPGSQMPDLGLEDRTIRALTYYMLSLRRRELPGELWPQDRIRAERFGAREFATDAATLYGTFCAACHGPGGQGMRYPGMTAFPAIANPDFLALANDDFITAAVGRGRPGRRMPAWAEQEGGLRPEEIAKVVGYLRALGGGVEPLADGRPRRWLNADAELGSRLYATHCARCHGAQGEGGEGTALANPVLLATATDTYLVETTRRGRRGTSMPSFGQPSTTWQMLSEPEIHAIVAFIRTWEGQP